MFVEEYLPDVIAFGASGGPMFNTSLTMAQGGQDKANRLWANYLGKWSFGMLNRTTAETELLYAFFNAVAVGRLNAFRFKSRWPGQSVGTDEPIGTAPGGSHTWQVVKQSQYVGINGTYPYLKPIYKLVAGTLVVKDNGSIVSPTSSNINNGTFVLTATAGHVITASYQFAYPVRFTTDWCPVEAVGPNAWSWAQGSIQETRTIA